jgi:hypothetical protein
MKKQAAAQKPNRRKGAPGADAAADATLDGVVGEGAELHL